MTLRKSLLLLISLSMIAALVACSSSSSTPPPPPPAITVTLTSPTTFPAILYVNDTLSVTATVANDSAQGGVIWSCTPGNSAATCGSFSSGANAAASGTAVTYTAPAGPVGAVTITATSVTDSTKSASSSSIAINATVISVTITTAPPSSMFAGANATVAATVTGDPAGLGVNWSCTPANACGSFNPTSTASAANTTYTAPSTAGNVTIVATSISDDTQSASAAVTVNAALVDGNYVYSLSESTILACTISLESSSFPVERLPAASRTSLTTTTPETLPRAIRSMAPSAAATAVVASLQPPTATCRSPWLRATGRTAPPPTLI